MHLARPTRIIPVLYSGRSGKKIHASENMSTGPIIQLSVSETANIFHCTIAFDSFSYLTLASGGYIIHNRPIAIGSETEYIR